MHNKPVPHGRHILIVDDEPLVRRSLSEFLTLQGYSVSSAANGKEALGLLTTYTADIVITDIRMPELDGLELLRAIRESPALEQLRFIMLSGMQNHPKLIEEVVFSGGRFLQKPFRVDELQQLVLEVLARADKK